MDIYVKKTGTNYRKKSRVELISFYWITDRFVLSECRNYFKPVKLPEYDNYHTECTGPSIFHENNNHYDHDGCLTVKMGL